MRTLRMLGGIGLTSADGFESDAVLRQTKSLALLAYLSMPSPGTWHRRDSLVAAFWPEYDQSRARTALRGALYTLRKNLDDGTIRTRGDDEVSLNPERLTTDVAAMIAAFDEKRFDDALALFSGDLLPALYVAEATGFEEWLEAERARLKTLAKRSAAMVADARASEGNVAGALDAARRGMELDPDDEVAARRVIVLLDASGDRSQALAVFERFTQRLADEFGVSPSAETLARVALIRDRQNARADSAIIEPPVNSSRVVSSRDAERGRSSFAPVSRKRMWRIALVGVACVAVASLVATRSARTTPATDAHRLVVLPMENATGDRDLDYIATGVAEDVARRLEGVGGFTVVSTARLEWPQRFRGNDAQIATRFNARLLLRMRLARWGDSLEVHGSIVDHRAGAKNLTTLRFTPTTMRDLESRLAAVVAGAVFRAPLPQMPRGARRDVDPESYRLTLKGWHVFLSDVSVDEAKHLFEEAIDRDQLNARAWSGLSSVLSAQVAQTLVPFDAGADRAESAADQALGLDNLEGSALTNLGALRTLRSREVAAGLRLIQQAKASEPANPEIFLIESALYRWAWQWDRSLDAIRVARRLDPLTPLFYQREADIAFCREQPEVALRLWNEMRQEDSASAMRAGFNVRAFAMAGRYAEAVDAWQVQAIALGDSVLARRLSSQPRDSAGYWTARHIEGESVRRRFAKRPYVSSEQAMFKAFLAGDTAAGFAALEAAVRQNDIVLAKVPCLPVFDEVRHNPRFKMLMQQVRESPIH